MENRPFAVLGVNVNGYPAAKLKEVMDKEKLNWRSFVDARDDKGGLGAISGSWNLYATPTLYLLDHRGVIRYRWIGGPGDRVIDTAIETLLKEAEAKSE